MSDKIRISKGATVNLGNYNSFRVEIALESDSKSYDEIDQFVSEKLMIEIEDAEAAAQKKEEDK